MPMLRAVTDAVRQGLTEHPLHPLEASIRTFVALDRIRSAANATRAA